MGLFDKIKDNAKTISMKAIEATREYDDEYEQSHQAAAPPQPITEDASTLAAPPQSDTEQANVWQDSPAPTEEQPISLEEPSFLDEIPEEQAPAEEAPEDKETESVDAKKPARKSKVTELSKDEHEQAEREKRTQKAKQAAKERLAKSYVPSYKSSANNSSGKTEEKIEVKATRETKAAAPKKKSIGIVDIAPGKFVDPTKKAIYARERAALNALASQRKLNGAVPLYTAIHMNFKSRVFINRIEYSGSFGKNVISIDQVAWIKLRHGGTGVIIETTEGKRIVMVVKQSDRMAFADAILKVQAMQPKKGKIRDTQTVRIDQLEQFGEGIDELEKLSKLFDKGILSQEEFDLKKKQILGI